MSIFRMFLRLREREGYQNGAARKEEVESQFGHMDVKADEVPTVSLFPLSSSFDEKRSFYTL